MIGTSLSHYRITEKLGQGGMGEVYRAEDTNLARQVAIKVLPDEFAHDAERLARFQREAQVLASLSHPNIATLYGLEESDGKRFIVMELVEGQTLAHRLLKGPLPLDEALDVCRQIAEGLEAAHEKGVIHRDLKPGNVMLTANDKVKILDFGLAKALAGDSRPPDATHSPTITEAMTRPGVVLGTAAYMSPEQARGKPVDKRADVWAFGCILYECLTGKRAFEAETITDTLAAILKGEPKWDLLPKSISSGVRTLLRRSLEKDPKQRFHDVADLRIGIDESLAAPAVLQSGAPPSQLAWRILVPWSLAALMAMLAVSALWPPWSTRLPESRDLIRFTIDLPPDERLVGPASAVAISRDSTQIVYAAQRRNSTQLWVRGLSEIRARALAGTEGARAPFFSPDGQWVGFFADGKMKKVRLSGGAPQDICAVDQPRSACWDNKDNILFGSRTGAVTAQEGLMRVPASGGMPEPASTAKRQLSVYDLHLWPRPLPASKAILFTRRLDLLADVSVLLPDTGKHRTLISPAACGRYVPTGHLVYAWQADLYAAPFDLGALETRGQPVRLIQDVLMPGIAEAFFDVSDKGALAYVPGGVVYSTPQLVWVRLDGEVSPLPSAPRVAQCPRVSPDGRHLVVLTDRDSFQLCDMDRDAWRRLTDGEGSEFWSVFSPVDGKRVIFNSTRKNPSAATLFWKTLEAGGKIEELASSDNHLQPQSFTPDGRFLVYQEGSRPDTGFDIWKVSLEGDRKPQPLIRTRFNEFHPAVSPDGHWLAYVTDEFGMSNVYVRTLVEEGQPLQVSTNGGIGPLWSPDGRQIYYRSPDGNSMMAVSFQGGPSFRIGKERTLFTGSFIEDVMWGRNYDIAPDGRRFLMIQERKPEPRQIVVVLNWSEELKRLAPTGK